MLKTLQVEVAVEGPETLLTESSLRRLYEQIHGTISALVCAYKHQRLQEEVEKISTNAETTNWK